MVDIDKILEQLNAAMGALASGVSAAFAAAGTAITQTILPAIGGLVSGLRALTFKAVSAGADLLARSFALLKIGSDLLVVGLTSLSEKGFNALGRSIQPLTDFIGQIRTKIAGFVAAIDPSKVYLFDLAVRDLQANIGAMMVPALEIATEIINTLSDNIAALSPPTQKMIAALVVAAVTFGGLTAAVVVFRAAVTMMSGGLLGLVTTLASAAVGLSMMSGGADSLSQTFERIVESLSAALSAAGDSFAVIAAAIVPLVEMLGGLLAVVISLVGSGVGVAFEVLGAVLNPLLAVLTPLIEVFGQLVEAVGQVWEAVGQAVVSLIKMIVALPIEVLQYAFSLIGEVIGMVVSLVKILAEGIGMVLDEFGIKKDGLKNEGKRQRAVVDTSFMSGQQMAQKAYASAYMLGSKVDHSEATAKNTQTMSQTLLDIKGIVAGIKSVVDFVRNPVKSTADAVGHAVGDPAQRFVDSNVIPTLRRIGINPSSDGRITDRDMEAIDRWARRELGL